MLDENFIPIQTQKINFFDSEEMNNALKGSDTEVYQVEKGNFEADLLSASLGKGFLDRDVYTRSIIVEGTFSSEHMGVGFILDAKQEGQLNGATIQKNDLALFNAGTELNIFIEPETKSSFFQFTREDFLKTGLSDDNFSVKHYYIDNKSKVFLSEKMSEVFNYLENQNDLSMPHSNGDMLYNHLLSVYAKVLDQNNLIVDLKKNDSYLMAKKISNYIREHSNDNLQMLDLTAEVGKSERTLERVFKKHFGITPYSYLKLHRLHMMRKGLLYPDPSFTSITHLATDLGFMQMGHFCDEYKKTFGETASETLLRNT